MARWVRGAGAVGALGLLLFNGLAWQHARAMTQFATHGERTPRPEDLTAVQTVQTLLFGVTIPRPKATVDLVQALPGARRVELPGPVGRLDVVVSSPTNPTERGVVVLVHGYANESSQVLPTALRLVAAGFTVVAPDLRAVGSSEGRHTSLGWHEAEDVRAVVEWVQVELGDPAPVLYGFSMGGAAVVGAAGRLGVATRGLVLESTFDRLIHTVGHRFETMGLPQRGLADVLLFWGGVQQRFDPWSVAPVDDARRVAAPALVVSGDQDRRVRVEESRALAAAFPGGGRLVLVEGMGHAQLAAARPDSWDSVVRSFLDDLPER